MKLETSKLIIVRNAAKALREDCARMLKTDVITQMGLSLHVVPTHNKIVQEFNSLKLSSIHVSEISGGFSIDLHEVITNCGQMIAIIDGALVDVSKEIKELKGEVERYKPYHALLKSYVETPEFKIETDLLEKLPKNIQKYLVEASSCYKNGEFIACCSMCGNVLEGIINAECKKRDISETNLLDKSGRLFKCLSKEGKKVEKVHENLVEVVKFYRDHASHPTEETFTRERASLFITTLLILCKEIFL
jgi:hypothetical protein